MNAKQIAACALVVGAVACARLASSPTPALSAASVPPAHSGPSFDTAAWVDSTLASLSVRDRVAQMVMVWMLGDYMST